ncbi:hypothetical protein L208DRAFT_1397569 [Tricholoma matsutake]|nr:hypothetical protein L208DRAFT_1397569 [Tricholoma matsutake 945]
MKCFKTQAESACQNPNLPALIRTFVATVTSAPTPTPITPPIPNTGHHRSAPTSLLTPGCTDMSLSYPLPHDMGTVTDNWTPQSSSPLFFSQVLTGS